MSDRTEPETSPDTSPDASADTSPDASAEMADAARQAAQRVVEEVSSWQYSAEPTMIADQLDKGLSEAQVTLSDEERSRILSEIDEMKDEHSSAPEVRSARPIT